MPSGESWTAAEERVGCALDDFIESLPSQLAEKINALTQVYRDAIDAERTKDGPLLTCPWCAALLTDKIAHAQISHLISCGDAERARREQWEKVAVQRMRERDKAWEERDGALKRAEQAERESLRMNPHTGYDPNAD